MQIVAARSNAPAPPSTLPRTERVVSPSPQQLFEDNRDLIRRAARSIARKEGVGDAEIEECIGWIERRLVANDHAILAQWDGTSELRTFLGVVSLFLVRKFRERGTGPAPS